MNQPADSHGVRHTFAADGDEFMLAVPGATGRLVRTGDGADVARVSASAVGPIQLAVLELGFPAVAEAQGSPESLVLCTMLNAPDTGRWEGVPLAPGQTFVYPAGASHHAADPAGLKFAMTVIPLETFERAATTLGVDPEIASPKRVVAGGPLWPIAASLHTDADWGHAITADQIMDGVLHTLATPSTITVERERRAWSDTDLVHEAISLIEHSEQWNVPMLTLCREVRVSERRLQQAFDRVHGIPPRAYMRYRALHSAHKALRDAEPGTSVSEIARAHGFAHPGRFAGFYRSVYGETPSASARGAVRRRSH